MNTTIPHEVPDNERGAFDISTFCLAYKLSRSMVYREIKDGRLRVMKVGCDSAWNKDPVFGVIGIQSGPRG